MHRVALAVVLVNMTLRVMAVAVVVLPRAVQAAQAARGVS